MMTRNLAILLIAAYLLIIYPFTSYLGNRPVVNKVGYLPEGEMLRFAVGDHRYLVSEWAVFKVMLYFGGTFDKNPKQLRLPVEYGNMARFLSTAVFLDPYNMDAYYLAQASFVWDVKDSARDINKLMAYGMRYRKWDYYLPFFAGFNAAYFLQDYKTAADYMKIAAELSGDPLFANLSARFFHQAGQTELGILFIKSMEKSAKDKKIKHSFTLRREALQAAKEISDAVFVFRSQYNRLPKSIEELVSYGLLKSVPKDPYGGQFYVTDKGKVESTSKFAFGGQGG
jgi:hypothetical protein